MKLKIQAVIIILLPLCSYSQFGSSLMQRQVDSLYAAKGQMPLIMWCTSVYNHSTEVAMHDSTLVKPFFHLLRAKAREAEDPEVEAFVELIRAQAYLRHLSDADSVLIILEDAADLAMTHELVLAGSEVLKEIAFIHLERGDFRAARSNLGRYLAFVDAMHNDSLLCIGKQLEGMIFSQQGAYDSAVVSYMEALEYLEGNEETNDEYGFVYSNLANTFSEMGFDDKAEVYYQKALQIHQRMDRDLVAAMTLSSLGRIYFKRGDHSSALASHQSALKTFLQFQDLPSLSRCYYQLGEVYAAVLATDSARFYYEKAIDLQEHIGLNKLRASSQLSLGFLLLETHPREAMDRAMSSRDLAVEIEAPDLEARSLKLLALAHAQLAQHRQAFEYFRRFKEMDDSLYGVERAEVIAEVEAKYDNERKQNQILRSKQEIDRLELENTRNVYSRNLLLIGSVAILLLSIVFIRSISMKRSREKTIHSQREALSKEQLKQERFTVEKLESEMGLAVQQLNDRNEIVESFRSELDALREEGDLLNEEKVKSLYQLINQNMAGDRDWDLFFTRFEKMHPRLTESLKLRYPALSANDLRFCGLLRLNLDSKSIATILNIVPSSVKKARNRLRKKMELGPEVDLLEFLIRTENEVGVQGGTVNSGSGLVVSGQTGLSITS